MKEIRVLAVWLFSMALFFLSVGGSSNYRQKEASAKIYAPLEREDITALHVQKEYKDLAIELNRVVFEEHRVIFDYTMKSSDLSKYEDVIVILGFEEKGMGGAASGFAVEEKPKEKRMIAYLEMEEGSFSQDDVGGEVTVVFESLYGAEFHSGLQMTFPVTVEKVFPCKTVEINQEFTYKGGTVVVESVDISPFYTDVHYMDRGAKEDFMMNLYGWEVTDESATALQCLGGGDQEYNYTALPEGCKEIGLTLIQYKKDASYDKLGETVKIPLQ